MARPRLSSVTRISIYGLLDFLGVNRMILGGVRTSCSQVKESRMAYLGTSMIICGCFGGALCMHALVRNGLSREKMAQGVE